jgi:hypothetical protein
VRIAAHRGVVAKDFIHGRDASRDVSEVTGNLN